jgi:alkylation response protein AidB-like acyl-CoA dehydrogenase
MSLMDLERSSIAMPSEMRAALMLLLAYVKEARADGKPLNQLPWVRQLLADMHREITIGWLLCHKLVWMQEQGQDATLLASYAKLYSSEAMERFANSAMEIVGGLSLLEPSGEAGKRWAPLQGLLSRLYKESRVMQVAGGTSEIQRNIIATRGLGLPRA